MNILFIGSVACNVRKNQIFYIYTKKMFKGHCFPKSIILQAVYFKLRFSLSYRDVEELMSIRGVKVDHTNIQRWVFKFTPLVEQQFRKREENSWKKMENG